MSNSVVQAAAAAKAKHLDSKKKLAKKPEEQRPAQDEQQVAEDDSDNANLVETSNEEGLQQPASMSDTSLASDFSFATALAGAAESAAAFGSEAAQDAYGDTAYDDGDDTSGGTLLLVGALGLVGAGIAVLVSGGGDGDSNEAPTITSGDTGTVAENAPITTVVYQVQASDPDGDALTYSLSGADAALFNISSTGAVTLKNPANFEADNSYTIDVNVSDGDESVSKTVTIGVTNVNEAPVPSANNTTTLTVDEDESAEFIIDFTDPEGETLDEDNIELVTGPTNGTISDDGTTYIPDADFNGTDSFTYRVTDSAGNSTTQTVNITVTPVNDDPEVDATQAVQTEAGADIDITVDATDIDSETLTYEVEDGDGPVNGTVVAGDDGVLTYTPDDGFVGTDTFTVTVSDEDGGSVQQVVTVTVGEVVEELSLDVGTLTTAATVDASDADFVLTDAATALTNVIITGFEEGDIIQLSGVDQLSDYNFSSGNTIGADVDDLAITYTDEATGTANVIIIDGALVNGGIVSNYAQAVSSVGFDFMTLADSSATFA